MEQKRESISADIVNAVSLDIDCADVVVKMGTMQEIIVEAEVDVDAEYVSEISGDKLYIRYQWKHGEKYIIKDADTAHITVTLPREKKLTAFELKLGAGRASLQETELDCGRIGVETGAGKIRAGKVNADEYIDVEIGAGSVEVASLQTQALKVECGVGQCDIDLQGRETDYNYDISCGIGKVSLNGNRMSGIGSTHTRNNSGALGNIKISCGLGKVNIKTA